MTMTAPHPAIGRSETVTDTLDLRQARHMQLTLDQDPTLGPGDPLPPFWHYLYFNPQIKASDLATDGHERLGRFLPDLGLPRRMWAGGSVTLHAPLPLGAEVTKTTTIRDVSRKNGRSGALGFVTVAHDFSHGGQHCMTEVQNIVYRAPPAPGSTPPAPPPAPEGATFSRKVTPDPVLLFRYSALIFYGHRIHYDAEYTREVEGYPGLIVHGPLTATLLIAFGMEQAGGRALRRYEIRAMSPLFAPAPFWLEGRAEGETLSLWARTEAGGSAMKVTLFLDD
ncbi:FAS1-like dehydratase domain-containing protein [Dinoroseobacter sp. S124A]|uniref:FAS1-like dehydratase domain-containing protein n=1 Tax=Dinoroseobacter sp. S124A TaxID=3415128 RepID=UPI003C7AE090